MLYLRSNLTFHELFEKNIRSDEMGAKRRQHNHKIPASKWAWRTLVRVRNDDDVHVMLRAAMCDKLSIFIPP